jgi:hypothetical protein
VVSGDVTFLPSIPILVPSQVIRKVQGDSDSRLRQPLMASLTSILHDITSFHEVSVQPPSLAPRIELLLAEKMVLHNWSSPSYASKVKKLVHALHNNLPFRSSKSVHAIHVWKVDVLKPEFPSFVVGDIIIESSFPSDNNTIHVDNSHFQLNPRTSFIQKLQRLLQKQLILQQNIPLTPSLCLYIKP